MRPARHVRALAPLIVILLATAPALARDSLGVFADWGAFRDPEVPRCYAIAVATRDGSDGYASVSHWPLRQVRGQVHFRLSRAQGNTGTPSLRIGEATFRLDGSGRDAWAGSARQDAQIVAALRAASSMQITARDAQGRTFSDSYRLDGAATAIDAASVACARIR